MSRYTVKHIKEVAKRLTDYEKGLVDTSMRWDWCRICESVDNYCNNCLINSCVDLDSTTWHRPNMGRAVEHHFFNEKTVFKRYKAMLKRANKNLKNSDWTIEGKFKNWKEVLKARE